MNTSNSLIKIVLVGDGASGKSCMIQSYLNDSFDTDYIPTVFDNYKATVQVENQTFQLAIWDTAGEEEYHLLRPLSYQQSDVFLICFPVNDRKSFRNAFRKWYPELQKHAPKTPKIFVGTMIDLRGDEGLMNKSRTSILQPTTIEEVETLISEANKDNKDSEVNATYLECSALTQEGLKAVFDEAIRTELRNRRRVDGKNGKTRSKKKNDCNMF